MIRKTFLFVFKFFLLTTLFLSCRSLFAVEIKDNNGSHFSYSGKVQGIVLNHSRHTFSLLTHQIQNSGFVPFKDILKTTKVTVLSDSFRRETIPQ